MKQTVKRTLALLLALVMVLGMVPVAAAEYNRAGENGEKPEDTAGSMDFVNGTAEDGTPEQEDYVTIPIANRVMEGMRPYSVGPVNQGELISDLAVVRKEITVGDLMDFLYMAPGEQKYQLFGINPQGAALAVESSNTAVATAALVDTPEHITGNQDLTCTANTPNERDDMREIRVTAVAPGRTTVTVTATAADYETTTYTFQVQVLAPVNQGTGRSDVNINQGWTFCLERDLPLGTTLEQMHAPDFSGTGFTGVNLPHTWNIKDVENELTKHYGVGYYRKELEFPTATYDGKRIFIELGAANKVSTLYLNGELVGVHQGGYAKFRYDITDKVKLDGENVLVVKVDNTVGSTVMPLEGGFAYNGGIYRDSFLISTADVGFDKLDYGSSGVYLTPKDVSAKSAGLNVRALLRNSAAAERTVTVEAVLYQQDGATQVQTLSGQMAVPAGGSAEFNQDCTVASPHLWFGVKDPYQYIVEVTVKDGDTVLERVRETVGFRFFEVTEDEGFFLNGASYRLHGVAMHQDWEDKGNTITSREIDENLSFISEIGATCLRLSHYQHDDYTYQLASERGLVVWAEIPNINSVRMTDAFRQNARDQLIELIRQNYNFASIFMWGTHNEQWPKGDLSVNKVLDDLYKLGKQEDPTRYMVVATAQSQETPLSWQGDISAWNKYFGWYEGANIDGFGPWVDKVRAFAKANETVSATATTGEDKGEVFTTTVSGKIGMSEYGSGSNIWTHELNPPDHVKSMSAFQSEEYVNKYHEITWKQIRERPWIWGTYIWNMFDFSQPGVKSEGGVVSRNTKGLVSFDRSLKKDQFYFYKVNWSDEPVVYITSRRFDQRYDDYNYIRVYSNLDEVEIFVNGVSKGSLKRTDPALPNTEQGNLIQDPSLGIFHFEGAEINFPDFGDYTVTAIGRRLAEDGTVRNEYSDTVQWQRLRDYRTAITSTQLIIDTANHTISKIPGGMSVADFLEKLTPAYNGTIAMLDGNGEELADTSVPLDMDMQVRVTAENGVDSQVYTLVDDPLSVGKRATASTVQGSYVAGNLTDGDLNTRWTASEAKYPQWVQLDLGEVSDLSKVSGLFYGEAPRAYQYKIFTSVDGQSFTPLVDRSANTQSQWVSDEAPAGTRARYVRVDISGITGASGNAALWELMVYGCHLASAEYLVDNAGCTVLGVAPDVTAGALLQKVEAVGNCSSLQVQDSQGRTLAGDEPVGTGARLVLTGNNGAQTLYEIRETTASTLPVSQGKAIANVNDVKSGSSADYVNDGNQNTFWNATNGFDPAKYIVIDLGRDHQITDFAVDFYQGSAKRYYQYNIYVSGDGQSFTKAVDNSGNSTQESARHAAPAGTTGRYVKLEVVGTSVANVNFAAAVREFQVYGWSMTSETYEIDHGARTISGVVEQTPVSAFQRALKLEGNYQAELLLDGQVWADGVVTQGMTYRVARLDGTDPVEYTIHTAGNPVPISRGMPCEAESKAGSSPALAVDGDPATFWNGPMADPNNAKYPVDFVVDLSNGDDSENIEYNITKVVASWYTAGDRTYQFSIYGVPNLIVETLWHDASENATVGEVVITDGDKNGSDVKMKKLHLQVTGRVPNTSYLAAALYELEVYGWLIKSEDYAINEAMGTISGIPQGTSVVRFRNGVDIRGNYTSRVLDADGVSVSEGDVETGMKLEITDVDGGKTQFTLAVGEAPKTYDVTVVNGTADAEAFAEGATVTVEAMVPEGQRFVVWSSEDLLLTDEQKKADPMTFTMPNHAVTVTAELEPLPPVITGVSVTPAAVTVQKGTKQQFTAVVMGESNYNDTVLWSVAPAEPEESEVPIEMEEAGVQREEDLAENPREGLGDQVTADEGPVETAIDDVSETDVSGQDVPAKESIDDMTVDTNVDMDAGVSVDAETANESSAGEATASESADEEPAMEPLVETTPAELAAGTHIDETGLLTVDAAETATTLIVTATAKGDDSKKATATVTVTDAEVTRYDLTVENGDGSGEYASGTELTVTANEPAAGKRFKEWMAEGLDLGEQAAANPLTIIMPGNAVTLTATYEDIPVDTTALGDAILAAEAAKNGVSVRDEAPASVPSGTKFVSTAEMVALDEAIEDAVVVKDTAASQEAVDEAAAALNAAVETFVAAIQTGTYVPSGGSSGGSSGNKTETEKHPDGSVTTIVTKPNGTVTETTKRPDGTTEVRETKKDGTVTETVKDKDGNQSVVETKKDGTVTETVTQKDGYKSETVTKPDGSLTQNVTTSDGVKSEIKQDAQGNTTADVKIPEKAIKDDEIVTLPIPAVDTAKENIVTVTAPKDTGVKVEVPVAKVKPSTVAVIVNEDGTETIVKTSIPTVNGLTLTVAGEVTVNIVDNSKDFADVAAEHWAAEAVAFVTSRELFNGTGADAFAPAETTSRAMLFTVLARLEGVETEGGETWYSKAMEWAKTSGISDGTIPEASITREQLATMLYRYAGQPAAEGEGKTFTDGDQVSDWAAQAMDWAVKAGILTGKNGNRLDPTGTATRAEVATMLQRFITARVG